MLESDVMEGQLLDGFLEALRALPDAQAEVSGAEQPGGRDRGCDAQVGLRVGGKPRSWRMSGFMTFDTASLPGRWRSARPYR